MRIDDLLRQQQRLADIVEPPALRLSRRIDDFLRQQRRLADMMDPPALRLSREVRKTNRLFQAYENPLRQFRLRDSLAGLSHDFNRTQQSIIDNTREAARPSEMLSVAMNQSLKNAELAESAIVRSAELAAVTKQTSERISLSATTATRIVEAARRNIEFPDSLSGFQRQFQRLAEEPFRQIEQLQKVLIPNFFPPHNLLIDSATTATRIVEAARRNIEFPDSLSGFQRQFQRLAEEPFRQIEQLQKVLIPNFFPPHNLLIDSATTATRIVEAARRNIEFPDSLSGFQRQFQRAMLEPLRQTAQLRALTGEFSSATAFFSQLHDILQAKTSLAVLDTTFTEEMQAWLHDGEAKTSEPEREEFLTYLFGWLIEKFQQLLQGRISLEALNTLLTISFFLYSTWSNSQMEDRLMEKLTVPASEKQIVRKMEEVRPNLTYRKRYVVAVTDRLRLRGEPSLEAPVLAFLLPNTLVEEIEQHESWSLVEFSDHADGSVKKGWVYRDYLQAIQPEKG